MRTGWMYLVVVLDWYSRYVVSWSLSDSLEVDFVLEAVEQAFAKARPKIINSDQGSQYTSPAYIQRVESAGVRISMDGRGPALDNVFTEPFLAFSEVRRGVFERLRDAATDPAVDLGLPRVLQRTPAPPGPQLPDAGYRLGGHRRRAVDNHIRVICREGEGVT